MKIVKKDDLRWEVSLKHYHYHCDICKDYDYRPCVDEDCDYTASQRKFEDTIEQLWKEGGE